MTHLLSFSFAELGPLIAFSVVTAWLGLRHAIAAAMICALACAIHKRRRGERLSSLFRFSLLMTLVFGAIDFWLSRPAFIPYEAVVANLAVAVFFARGAATSPPLVWELATQSGRMPRERPADLVSFFRALTLLWAGYHLLKAGVYAWLAARLPLEQLLVARAAIGWVTFVPLLAACLFAGPHLYRLFDRSGVTALVARWFPGDVPSPLVPRSDN